MIRPVVLACFLVPCYALIGCSEKQEGTVTSTKVTTRHADHGSHDHHHDHHHGSHEDAGHKHGEFNQNIDFAINYDDHFHAHDRGRFGGLLAVLGSHQYHAEFIPDKETGAVLAILYDRLFKPIKMDVKELTVSLLVDGQPKQFTLLVDFEGSAEKPALYKINDATLANLLHDGWTGNALVAITVDDKPVAGQLTAK